jgi:hypothetical protein
MLFVDNKPNVAGLATLLEVMPDFAKGLVYSLLVADEKHFEKKNEQIIRQWLADALAMIEARRHENVSINSA